MNPAIAFTQTAREPKIGPQSSSKTTLKVENCNHSQDPEVQVVKRALHKSVWIPSLLMGILQEPFTQASSTQPAAWACSSTLLLAMLLPQIE